MFLTFRMCEWGTNLRFKQKRGGWNFIIAMKLAENKTSNLPQTTPKSGKSQMYQGSSVVLFSFSSQCLKCSRRWLPRAGQWAKVGFNRYFTNFNRYFTSQSSNFTDIWQNFNFNKHFTMYQFFIYLILIKNYVCREWSKSTI